LKYKEKKREDRRDSESVGREGGVCGCVRRRKEREREVNE
jgi:hypothetical protein